MDELNGIGRLLDVWDVDHAEGYDPGNVKPTGLPESCFNADFGSRVDAQRDGQSQPAANEPLPDQVTGIPGYPVTGPWRETYASLQQLAVDYPELVSVTGYWR